MGSNSASTRAFEAVVRYFEENDWKFTPRPEEQTLIFGVTGKNGRYQCFAHVGAEHPVVSVHSIAGVRVPEARLSAMAEFLIRANYGLCIGNFAMDFSDGEVRYKTSLDIRDGELTAEMIEVLVHANLSTMDRYFSGMLAVVSGHGTPAAAVARVEETFGTAASRDNAAATGQRPERREDGSRHRFPWMSN
jgi:hypothetical protein